jgi:endonuclease V-like protein UPF0215 family
MIYSMNLIESIIVDGSVFSFYNGIDFDIVMNHPDDGSNGFIFCFIENWVDEVKSWERESKLDSVLNNKLIEEFNSKKIENNYLAIYQLQGTEPGVLFEIIKEKVIKKNFPEHPWIPISGLEKGAWRIGKTKISN